MEKLSNIAKKVLVKMDEPSNQGLARLMSIGREGLQQLNMDVSGAPSMIKLTIDQNNKTAPIPPNMINIIRMMVCINGRLYPLADDQRICLPPTPDECGDLVYDQPQNISQQQNFFATTAYPNFTDPTYYDGTMWGGYFNTIGGDSFYGRYRADYANNVFVFQSLIRSVLTGVMPEFILEYLADPTVDNNGDFNVHQFDALAIQYYIYWQSIDMKTGVSLGEKGKARNDYYNELRKARIRHQSTTFESLQQAVNRSLSSTAKYGV